MPSKAEVRKYFKSLCGRVGPRPCPRCGHVKVYLLSDGRRRCRTCRYTFHALSGRWLSQTHLTDSQWMTVAKGFSECRPPSVMAQSLGVSLNTVRKAVKTLRFAIAAQAPDAPILFGHQGNQGPVFTSLGRGRWDLGPPEQVPVFGVKESEGRAHACVIAHLRAETVFGLSVRKVRRGNLVYTDRFHDFDCLLFCGLDRLEPGVARGFTRQRVYADEESGFWRFAKPLILGSTRLCSPQAFPLFMKELEFRYNHRDTDPLPDLIRSLCAIAPGAFDGVGRVKGEPFAGLEHS